VAASNQAAKKIHQKNIASCNGNSIIKYGGHYKKLKPWCAKDALVTTMMNLGPGGTLFAVVWIS
jgi:hypothetical protein